MKNKISNLYNKYDKLSYSNLLELEEITANSDKLYLYFNDLLELIKSDKSFVKVRGFRLIASLAKWDKDDLINKNIESILSVFDDPVSTRIRQYLAKVNLILLYKPELNEKFIEKIKMIDVNKFKDMMKDLILRDINNVIS